MSRRCALIAERLAPTTSAWPSTRMGSGRAPRSRTSWSARAWWLGRLPEGWHLFNDIPVGERGANIDHVIVGPAGVFTVNAKNLTGAVWIASRALLHNGRKTSYLPKAVSEAKRAARMLSAVLGRTVQVRPVLAILADEWTIEEKPVDVLVDAPRGVKDWLLHQPVVLSGADVIAICAAAAKPATWTSLPS